MPLIGKTSNNFCSSLPLMLYICCLNLYIFRRFTSAYFRIQFEFSRMVNDCICLWHWLLPDVNVIRNCKQKFLLVLEDSTGCKFLLYVRLKLNLYTNESLSSWPRQFIDINFPIVTSHANFPGIYHSFTGGKQKTTDEYLRGGSTIGILPATLSLTISYMSSITVLGYPAEMYTFGGQYLLNSFGWALGYFLSGFIYVPVLYPLKTTTTNEVIEFFIILV